MPRIPSRAFLSRCALAANKPILPISLFPLILHDAMKRIGVVERSGRGVDKIFRGMLKFGRPAPDYAHTSTHSVVLRLPTTEADLDFRRRVVEHERANNAELPIDSLIALAALRATKRVTADELAVQIQRDAASAKRTLEALTEAGLVEAHGSTRGRSYALSASLYQAAGDKAASRIQPHPARGTANAMRGRRR